MQTQRRVWWLDYATRLEPLMNWCLENHAVDRLLVVSRLSQESDEPELLVPPVEEAVLELFADRILDRRCAGGWPGTRLVKHDALVTRVEFSIALVEPMVAAAELLRDWRHSHSPPLPEDLCLYRHGEPLPVLVSATHKGSAWLLTDREVRIEGAELGESDLTEYIPPADRDFVGESLKYADSGSSR